MCIHVLSAEDQTICDCSYDYDSHCKCMVSNTQSFDPCDLSHPLRVVALLINLLIINTFRVVELLIILLIINTFRVVALLIILLIINTFRVVALLMSSIPYMFKDTYKYQPLALLYVYSLEFLKVGTPSYILGYFFLLILPFFLPGLGIVISRLIIATFSY